MADPWVRKEMIGLLDGVCFLGFPDTEVVLYGFSEVGRKSIVYVGSTSQPIKARVRSHVGDARKGSLLPVHEWLRLKDFKFVVHCLGFCSEEMRSEDERRLVSEHAPRLNVTDGGAGMSGHSFAGTLHAQRIGTAQRTGDHFNCEECDSQFWRKKREINLGNNRFCSRSCYHQWQRGRPKKQRVMS